MRNRIGLMAWIAGKLRKPGNAKEARALIIGAGEVGTMIAASLRRDHRASIVPVGFIDDDPEKKGTEIAGLPVLGNRSDIVRLASALSIDMILIAMPSARKSELAAIVRIGQQTGAEIRMFPQIADLIHGHVPLHDIPDIDVKELLGREMIQPTPNAARSYLLEKTVLITGAGGSIGSELVYQIAESGPGAMLLLGHGENSIHTVEMQVRRRFPDIQVISVIADIQDRPHMEELFGKYKPHVVFHAAAHKHVPLMELNEGAAVKNNVFGTKIVTEAADRHGVERFVFISTDKAVHPVNVMGMTKRIGEMLVQQLAKKSRTRFSVVRFGNVLESRGSVIPIFKKQIAAGGPVTVTHPEMVRYFMTIPEAVQLVLEAGALSIGGELFVLDMGEPVKILDVAETLIRMAGYTPNKDIAISFTGVRPGEKLSESLFYEDERKVDSSHPRIAVALPKPFDEQRLQQGIQELEAALGHAQEPIRDILKRIIG